MSQSVDRSEKPSGCLVRLGWMLIGNVVLAICGIAIAQTPGRFSNYSVADVIFWVTVVALVGLRYVDIRYFNGRKADNTPADMNDFRRYAMLLPAAAGGAWVILHLGLFA
jgi:hypothetical protein